MVVCSCGGWTWTSYLFCVTVGRFGEEGWGVWVWSSFLSKQLISFSHFQCQVIKLFSLLIFILFYLMTTVGASNVNVIEHCRGGWKWSGNSSWDLSCTADVVRVLWFPWMMLKTPACLFHKNHKLMCRVLSSREFTRKFTLCQLTQWISKGVLLLESMLPLS